jgi:hypothetical protein
MFKMSRSRATMLTTLFPQMQAENLQSWTFRELSREMEPFIRPDREVGRKVRGGKTVLPSVQELLSEQGLEPLPIWVGSKREGSGREMERWD